MEPRLKSKIIKEINPSLKELFGYRNFVSDKIYKNFIGLVFIILSFNVDSNLLFVIGLSTIHLIIKLNPLNIIFQNFLKKKATNFF